MSKETDKTEKCGALHMVLEARTKECNELRKALLYTENLDLDLIRNEGRSTEVLREVVINNRIALKEAAWMTK